MQVNIINKSKFNNPEYATKGAAGMDLRANITEPLILKKGERVLIPTGVCIELLEGYEAQIRARSGLALKHGITVLNGIGTIDGDYRAEIGVILINTDKNFDYTIYPNDKIAQLIVARFERVEWNNVDKLTETERGGGGFGHTGK